MAAAVRGVLFVTVIMLLRWSEAQTIPTMSPECLTSLPDLLDKCFTTPRETPTEDCCNTLKSATDVQIECLCDHYIAKPNLVNITGPFSAGITTKCGVFDKYTCNGIVKGGESKKEEGSNSNSNSSSSSSNKDNNGGGEKRIGALMAAFGLVATMIFILF